MPIQSVRPGVFGDKHGQGMVPDVGAGCGSEIEVIGQGGKKLREINYLLDSQGFQNLGGKTIGACCFVGGDNTNEVPEFIGAGGAVCGGHFLEYG